MVTLAEGLLRPEEEGQGCPCRDCQIRHVASDGGNAGGGRNASLAHLRPDPVEPSRIRLWQV